MATAEDIDNAKTNYEAAQLSIAELNIARRRVALFQAPTIRDVDMPDALGIPPSLWGEQKRRGDSPRVFLIGRRAFCTTADAIEWLNKKAEGGAPGSKARRAAAGAK
jgi:hypothetical protein